MRALDLFSGLGGFSLGLERAGMRTVAFCEINPYCRAVLKKHWPDVPIYEDVRTLPRIDGVDLICGGVPCQPASVAGKRRGSADDRWLWPAFFEVVQSHRPSWVVAENPLGLVSLKPDGLQWVCRAFRELGYDPWPVVISAHDVGAPHLRRRIWIVAADADSPGSQLDGRCTWRSRDGTFVSIPGGEGLEEREGAPGERSHAATTGSDWWAVEPGILRVAHGVPSRVERLKALGNSLVPQIAEAIGRAIIKASEVALT